MLRHPKKTSMMTISCPNRLVTVDGIMKNFLILDTSHFTKSSGQGRFNNCSKRMQKTIMVGTAILCFHVRDRSRYMSGLKWFRIVAKEMRRKEVVIAMMKGIP